MKYFINYSIENMVDEFLKIREVLDITNDEIICVVDNAHLSESEKEGFFKSILKWEGEFRSTTNRWSDRQIRVHLRYH